MSNQLTPATQAHLTANAGEGWTSFTGDNQPAPKVLCEVVTRGECLREEWVSQVRAASGWDWSIDDVPGDIVAFKLVEAA